jgi:predicted RNA-binding protein with PIN domain
MKVYVDGNDLVEYFRENEPDTPQAIADREAAQDNVANWLARYARARDCDVVLVFDETRADDYLPYRDQVGGVTLLRAAYGVGAVREIAGPANQQAAEQDVTVVTDDIRLKQAVAHGGASAQGCASFVAQVRRLMGKDAEQAVVEPDEKFSGLSESEVDQWIRFFEEET